MRQLVVCCDGTWQKPGDRTNVHRLATALAPVDGTGREQICEYFPGVGAGGSVTARVTGGVAGEGLSEKVIDAYIWATSTYQEDDRIALFGFSRGAYTARSVAGMISACGLLDLSGLAEAEARRLVERVYTEKYRAGNLAQPSWRRDLRFHFDPVEKAEIPVWFIGVWDTVGSLGVPDHLGLVNLVDSPLRYQFHDVTLNPFIAHARHAIALDEFRGPFTPTLWAAPRTEQDLEQVWFPGDHGDVGGGHRETGLSDGALTWMMEEATTAVDLAFDEAVVAGFRPQHADRIHGSARSASGPLARVAETLFQPRPRAVPLLSPDAPNHQAVHASAYARQREQELPDGPYRPTRLLGPGQSVTVEVAADDPWSETGLYLGTGLHRFTAKGSWRSGTLESGPAGASGGGLLRPRAIGQLAGTLLGRLEDGFRRLSRNGAADFIGARREETLPWQSLVGIIANEVSNIPRQRARPHERIAIGAGVEHDVARPGYLYAFANDAWGFYGNNRGRVRLTVTRV